MLVNSFSLSFGSLSFSPSAVQLLFLAFSFLSYFLFFLLCFSGKPEVREELKLTSVEERVCWKGEVEWIKKPKSKPKDVLLVIGKYRLFLFETGKKGLKKKRDVHLYDVDEISSANPETVESVSLFLPFYIG
jgi:hypothetical protein